MDIEKKDVPTIDIKEDGQINFIASEAVNEITGQFKTKFTGKNFPRFIPTEEAMSEFGTFYKRTEITNQPIKLITDPVEIKKCEEEMDTTTGIFQHPYGGQAVYPIIRPGMPEGKQYGTQFENAPFARLIGLTAVIVIALVKSKDGEDLLCLVKHYRVTMSHFPAEEGGGWEWEPITCGQRKDSTIEETIAAEIEKEGNMRVLSKRKLINGYAQQPGSNGEPTEPWLVYAEIVGEPVVDHFEGIKDRIFLSKKGLAEFCKKEIHVDPITGEIAKTNLLHTHSAAYLLDIFNIW